MAKIEIDKNIHMGQRISGKGYDRNWVMRDLKTFKPSQGKSIFVFGGNATNRYDAANGNAKVLENLLNDKNKGKVDIYSFVYDTEPISAATRALRQEYINECNELFNRIFKPLLLDKLGNVKTKQGLEKVFKNNIIVSHCGGSEFANIIIENIYDTIAKGYHPSVAKQLIQKLQYFSYAPSILPMHNVKGYIITPFYDYEHSWTSVLNEVQDKRIDISFPKGSVENILKEKEKCDVANKFKRIYNEKRLIAFRSEDSTYIIPSQINADRVVGDHSIDCLTKLNVLEANNDISKTAKIVNYVSKLILNQFVDNCPIDDKTIFNKIIERTNLYPVQYSGM